MTARFKPILPRKFNSKALSSTLQSEVSAFSNDARNNLLRPTATWNTPSKFQIQTTTTRARIRVLIFTEDNKYRFLDQGTRVRYATMTPNFSPKTRPNTLSASSGQGSVAYVDRGRPRKGIQARNFVEQVKEIQEPKLRVRFNNAFRIGAIRSGHAI